MIIVENLVKSFNSTHVLQGVDHVQGRGEAVVLIGPSGCGKSTFLRCLNQLEQPDSGRITIGGSASLRRRRSQVTASLAKRLLAQGMIVIGKTHTVEFAMGGWGTNQHLGTPWNPWDANTARTPGGSSSGSGVAVAARLAPWAIGTDTGGSVRLPASFCGLAGLKVTVGRISTHGVMPLSTTLDTPGPMARSVEDAALLYDVLQGEDPLDPTTRGVAPDDPLPGLRRWVRGLRLARMPAAEVANVSRARRHFTTKVKHRVPLGPGIADDDFEIAVLEQVTDANVDLDRFRFAHFEGAIGIAVRGVEQPFQLDHKSVIVAAGDFHKAVIHEPPPGKCVYSNT